MMSLKMDPQVLEPIEGDTQKALELLRDLHSCLSEISDVRGMVRNIDKDNAVFIKQLAAELPSGNHLSSPSVKRVSDRSSNSDQLRSRVAALEEENRRLLSENLQLRSEVDSMRNDMKARQPPSTSTPLVSSNGDHASPLTSTIQNSSLDVESQAKVVRHNSHVVPFGTPTSIPKNAHVPVSSFRLEDGKLTNEPVADKHPSQPSTFKKLFSVRWKKQDVHPHFKRSHLRATTGPMVFSKPLSPAASSYAQWTTHQLASWLPNWGLDMYVTAFVQKNVTGSDLLTMGEKELHKLIMFHHPLHLRKLMLAVQNATREEAALRYPSDFNIVRWLDDIGLPQYKDSFSTAGIDPLLLDNLRYEDLVDLKVTNELHVASIRRGIQALRSVDWQLDSLIRRGGCPDDLTCWTSHQVMEWLRNADLAEYAVNLRGSGVHGALLALEPKFTCDLLAQLLSIPSSKSLLRRHLASHFVTLVGAACQEQKLQSSPLSFSTKIRLKQRRVPSFLMSSSRQYFSGDEIVCPRSSNSLDQLLKMRTPVPPKLTHF